MEFKDLVALYFERTNAMQALWSIYITIVLGLIGFLSAAKLKKPRLLIFFSLLIAFLGFAFVNCDALRSVTSQRHIVADLIWQFKDPPNSRVPLDRDIQPKISNSLDPWSVGGVVAFHIAGDILTIIAMVALTFGDRQPRLDDAAEIV